MLLFYASRNLYVTLPCIYVSQLAKTSSLFLTTERMVTMHGCRQAEETMTMRGLL